MSFGSSPKTPVTPAPVPTVATPAVEAAAEAQRRRERTASGKAATMLTGGMAATPMTATKQLLGS